MNKSCTTEPLLFSEYPVSTSKLKIAKNICIFMSIFTAAAVVYLTAKSVLFAPPRILNVSAEPSFCPGSLKVALKDDHNAILSCSTTVSGNENSYSIVINRLSVVAAEDVFKIVAVLNDGNESDPTVVASLPSLADSDLLREFVINALNKSKTNILHSASYYWGIGSSPEANLGLIDTLLEAGIPNPTTRINDAIMRELASNYLKLNQSEIPIPVNMDKESSDVENQNAELQCEHASGQSGLSCKLAHTIIDFAESTVIKVMMFMMIMMMIFSAIMNPNVVMLLFSLLSVLFLANLPSIIRAFII